jgi:cyclophilin family peptidyl-prolyl cis-trans isomerase
MLTSCRNRASEQGNMRGFSDLQAGDIYAEITVRGFDGKLTFILFDEIAPVGVEKFTLAANSGYYDGKTFHRVLQDMMIQGGALNTDGSDATIPEGEFFETETDPHARNFYGALAFAVDESNGKNYRQFLIVTNSGKVDINADKAKIYADINELSSKSDLSEEETAVLESLREMHRNLSRIPDDVKERYEQLGGLYLLDGKVTVFGQLITGRELLEQIAAVDVVAGNKIDDVSALNRGRGQPSRPADDVFIDSVRIIRIAKEEATEATTTRRRR